jgi:hypothetical protein
MVKLVAQRLVVTWIALSAILFAALSPTISHALSEAVAATETVQVCTAQGMVTVTVDKADAGKPAPAPDHLAKHCTYCATHGGAPALLPGQAFVVPLLSRDTSHPPLFYQSATPLFAWAPGYPRAPPSLS